MTRERPPRRISTVRVRPTEGRAPTTTSRMAVSRSPAGAPDARTGSGSGAAATSSGLHTSQQAPDGVGRERSPKWRRIASRRHDRCSTNAHTARYWRQRERCASPAEGRQWAGAAPSSGPRRGPRPGPGVGGRGRGPEHAGAGQVPHERAQLVYVAAREAAQLAGAEVVAPALTRVQL